MPHYTKGQTSLSGRSKHQTQLKIRLARKKVFSKLRGKPKKAFAYGIAALLFGRKFSSSFFNMKSDLLVVNEGTKLVFSLSTATCSSFLSSKGTVEGIKALKPKHDSDESILRQMELALLMRDHEFAKKMNLDQEQSLNFIIKRIRQREVRCTVDTNEHDFFFDADEVSYIRRTFIHEHLKIKNIPATINKMREDNTWLAYRPPGMNVIRDRATQFSAYLTKLNEYLSNPTQQLIFSLDDVNLDPTLFAKERVDLVLLYLVADCIHEILKKLRSYLDRYYALDHIYSDDTFFEDKECLKIIKAQTHEFVLLTDDQSDYRFFEIQLRKALHQELQAENEARREWLRDKQGLKQRSHARKGREEQENESLKKLRRLSRVSYKVRHIDHVDYTNPDDDINLESFTERQEEKQIQPFIKSSNGNPELIRDLLLSSRKSQIENERIAHAELKPFYAPITDDSDQRLVPDEVAKHWRLKHNNLTKYFKDRVEKGVYRLGNVLAVFNIIFYSLYSFYKALTAFSAPLANYIVAPFVLVASLYNSYHFGFKKINKSFLTIGTAFSDHLYEVKNNVRKNKKGILKVLAVIGVVATYTASSILLFHNSIYKLFEKGADLVLKLSKLVGGILVAVNPHILLPIVIAVVALSTISSIIIYYHQVDHGLPDSVRQSARKAWNDLKDAYYTSKSKFACYLIGYIIGVIFTVVSTIVEVCGNHTSFKEKFNYQGLIVSMLVAGIIGNTLYNLPDTIRGLRKMSLFVVNKIKDRIKKHRVKKGIEMEAEEEVSFDEEVSTYKKLLTEDFYQKEKPNVPSETVKVKVGFVRDESFNPEIEIPKGPRPDSRASTISETAPKPRRHRKVSIESNSSSESASPSPLIEQSASPEKTIFGTHHSFYKPKSEPNTEIDGVISMTPALFNMIDTKHIDGDLIEEGGFHLLPPAERSIVTNLQ